MTSTRNIARKVRRANPDVRVEHASKPERVIVYGSAAQLAAITDSLEGVPVVKFATADASAFVGVTVMP